MTLKGAKTTIKEITQKMNVRYALEGSVRKSGNDLRITAQLIDGLTDTHLWAEKPDLQSQVFKIFIIIKLLEIFILLSIRFK